jgi:hypothetical protein
MSKLTDYTKDSTAHSHRSETLIQLSQIPLYGESFCIFAKDLESA